MQGTDSLFAFNEAIFHLEGPVTRDKSTLLCPGAVGSWLSAGPAQSRLPHVLPMGARAEERQRPHVAASGVLSHLQWLAAKDIFPVNEVVKNKIVLWFY